MSECVCETVPPTGGNFEEYLEPEDNAVEDAQGQAHRLRLEVAATIELVEQNRAQIRKREFVIAELERELGKLGVSV